MNEASFLFIYPLAGLIGGLLRYFFGFKRSHQKNGKFFTWRLAGFLLISSLIGLLASLIACQTWEFSFLSGYVSVDLMDMLAVRKAETV